jgi:hypothetical protein
MSTSGTGRTYHSRFQVLTTGEPAWAIDDKGDLYRFDGFFFSRRRRRQVSFAIIPSWQAPRHGWVSPADCGCAPWPTDASRHLEDPGRRPSGVAA